MSRALIVVIVGTLLAARGASATPDTPPDPVTEWSVAASQLAAAAGMAPLRTPITLALVHLAMHDAVAACRDRDSYVPVSVSLWPDTKPGRVREASDVAAAIEAGYRVLLVELPSQQAAIDAAHVRLLSAVPESPAKTNGVRVGAAAAARLLHMRANDGRNATVPYVPTPGPGSWEPTPPAFLPATTAFLAKVTPFTMDSPSRLRPGGPPRLKSRQWAEDYNEVKARGAKDSTVRSAEETATALFWEPFAGTVWPATIRRLSQEQELDLPTSARFQAAGFVAFADAVIACWDAKYHFNFWRPVTAIRHGDTDGNDLTEADPDWEPLAVTPNFPDYTAGHACVTSAISHTIEAFFEGRVPIPARNVVSGEERVYKTADAVTDEVVEARMLLGVHFRSADEDGADVGRRVARRVRRMLFRSGR